MVLVGHLFVMPDKGFQVCFNRFLCVRLRFLDRFSLRDAAGQRRDGNYVPAVFTGFDDNIIFFRICRCSCTFIGRLQVLKVDSDAGE